MRIAIIVGNGLTLSLLSYLGSPLHSSRPLGWDIQNPESGGRLLDALPSLNNFVLDRKSQETDFELFSRILASSDVTNDSRLSAILDAGHYLAIGYSWFQLELDKLDFSDWEWRHWFEENSRNIVACLSWNYELVVERVIEHTQTPIFYDIERMPLIRGASSHYRVNLNRSAVGVYKPHGSINFSPCAEIRWGQEDLPRKFDDHPKYPRRGHVLGYAGPMKILSTHELLAPRDVADLVLPGEINRFKWNMQSDDEFSRSFNQSLWSPRQIQQFKIASSDAERLIIVGFGMQNVDKEEFLEALSGFKCLRKVVVVDPNPNPELIRIFTEKDLDVTCLYSTQGL